MRLSLALPLTLLALALSGCVQTQATMLSSKSYPPLEPEDVTIYLAEDDIEGDFERVAIINASGSTTYTRQDQLYAAVRKRAAAIGANGVLFAEIDEPSAGAKIAGAFFGVGVERQAEMVAIFVFSPDDELEALEDEMDALGDEMDAMEDEMDEMGEEMEDDGQ